MGHCAGPAADGVGVGVATGVVDDVSVCVADTCTGLLVISIRGVFKE
jgi:hypothetical protein